MSSRFIVPYTAFSVTSRRTKRQRAGGKDHLAFIRSLPCVVTGRTDNVEAAHISYADPQYGKLGRGKGQKEDDCWTLPLCRDEHNIQHQSDEGLYWAVRRINPLVTAAALYIHSGDYERAILILQNAVAR